MRPKAAAGSIAARLFFKKLDPTSVNLRDANAWFGRQRRTYRHLIAPLRGLVDPSRTVVDVGANIGYFSRQLFDSIGFEGRGYLFEPVPHLAQLCREQFLRTDYDAVVEQVALGDARGESTIYVANNGNLGWNTMIGAKAQPGMTPIAVQVRVFDELHIEDVGFIKIDVEGFEYRVLRGMLRSLSCYDPSPIILCELGWGNAHPDWPAALGTYHHLLDMGYQTYDLRMHAVDIAQTSHTSDVLFIPR